MTTARLLRIWGHRLRSILRRDAVELEVASELAFHRELLVRERIDAGVPRDQAEREATLVLGNVAALRDECRDQRRVTWWHDLYQDLGYGLRMLRRDRGISAIAVASLALGIGATAAVLSVTRAIVFGSLSFPAADRLVVVRTVPVARPGQESWALLSDYLAWRERNRTFETIGVSHGFPGDLGGDVDEPAQRIEGQLVDHGFFAALAVKPIAGRLFSDAEDAALGAPHSTQLILISERLWIRRFNRDPAIVGREIRLNRRQAVVVGVLPATFAYPDGRIDYWLPMARLRASATDSARLYAVVGRLKPGVTIQMAEADLNRLAADVAREQPGVSDGWGVRLLSLRTAQYRWAREPLLTVGVSSAIVLLLACVNVAGLLLARATARRPELALRAALGASRGRIARQLLTESLLLAVIAGGCSAVVVWWGVRAMRWFAPLPGVPALPRVGIDAGVIALVGLLTLITCVGIGLAPALAAVRGGGVDLLRACTAATVRRSRDQRLRGVLVSAQVALALVLLVGAGLLVNTVVRVASRDLGFDSSGLLTCEFQISPIEFLRPSGSYRGAAVYEISPPPALALRRVLERMAAVPGVVSAAGISHHPTNSFLLPRMPLAGLTESRALLSSFPVHFLVTPRFFSTMRAPLVAGREIEEQDTDARPWVAVVNEAMAHRFWPGESPIGKQFTIDTLPSERTRTIVGVVRDIPTRREQTTPEAVYYTSYLQQEQRARAPWGGIYGRMTFVIRAAGDPLLLVGPLRHAVAEIEPDRPLSSIATGDPGDYFWLRKMHVAAVSGLAVIATLLASLGVYGIMAYTLAGRAREIAIRAALGAGTREIVRAISWPSLTIVGAGIALGLGGAVAFGTMIESQLWGVSATDRPTFAIAALMLVAAAALACVGPVRNALRIDPSTALRAE